jgi:ABC-2 type transport system permease protein
VTDAFAEQVGQLARRSVVRTARQPANVVFPLVFPLLLLSVNSTGLQSATQLPGFPTDSYFAFALAVPFMQGALFATITRGRILPATSRRGF